MAKKNKGQVQSRFLYHGSAIAAQGQVVGQQGNLLPCQAAVTLPTVGGTCTVRLDRPTTPGLVEFTEAVADISGTQEAPGKQHVTKASARLSGLQVAGRLLVEPFQVQLISRHPPVRRRRPDKRPQPSIVPLGTSDTLRLTLDGEPITVRFSLEVFSKYPTMDALRTAFEKRKFRLAHSDKFFTPRNFKRGWTIPESDGAVSGTLVESIEYVGRQERVQGHTIVVPDFGTLYFGEFYVTEDRRRLIGLRLRLGSGETPAGALAFDAELRAELELGSVETNGATYPR